MSKHKMHVTIPHGDPDLGAEIDCEIAFAFVAGSPDTYDAARGGPGGWDPGYPPEIDFLSVEPFCNGKPSPFYGAYADLEQAWLDNLARDWLESDDGGHAAMDQVRHDDEAGREYAAELRADR